MFSRACAVTLIISYACLVSEITRVNNTPHLIFYCLKNTATEANNLLKKACKEEVLPQSTAL